jgi:hypothetical protein
VAYAPPSGKLSVGVWKIRLREKWNIVKIDWSHKKIGPVDAGVCQIIDFTFFHTVRICTKHISFNNKYAEN